MNPLLALRVAEYARDAYRQHPWRWRILAALPLAAPLLAALLLAGVLIAIADDSSGSPETPADVPGIPPVMLAAYARAAQRVAQLRPDCRGMRWAVLAGIAQEESHHAAGRTIAPNGDITPPVLGPPLDGSGTGGNRTPIRNLDGTFARAEGPFQFLSTTWSTVAQDGNDDGTRNPQNAFDAALTAAVYLCGRGPRDFGKETDLRDAIYSYNASQVYVDQVLSDIRNYDALQLHRAAVHSPASGQVKQVIDAAMSQLGVTYAWGGGTAAGPSRGIRDGGEADRHGDYNKVGFDCSGLTLYAYARVGITLPHQSGAQFALGTRLPKASGLAALRPGDLVFYSPGIIHHVGIYLGDGQMINAFASGTVVRKDPVDLHEYAGGVRLLP
ncbi:MULTISPECIES: C40 family peptidase [unclassified Amycolatopsis]|uniref:C40 family peptidase n=1 Tax=unclassified Amycolatopsis TaxID=2618356 RepID=UPI00106E3393|nr:MULTISPECIES: NlpC/P60 family protein [unclassified Amycolatopsis]